MSHAANRLTQFAQGEPTAGVVWSLRAPGCLSNLYRSTGFPEGEIGKVTLTLDSGLLRSDKKAAPPSVPTEDWLQDLHKYPNLPYTPSCVL